MNTFAVRSLALCAAAVALASGANAQNLTTRLTQQNWNAVYGGGETAFTPSDSFTTGALLASDTNSMAFADSQSGYVLGDPQRPWSASVSVFATQSFSVTGPLENFSRIDAAGRALLQASASGEGLAAIHCVNPGNYLLFEFSVDAPIQANLSGIVSLDPNLQNLTADVTLLKFDGFIWGYVFSTIFLPGQEGVFDQNLDLGPGQYRLASVAGGGAADIVQPYVDNSWSYSFSVVPEPATLATLGVGVAALLRRWRRSVD
jgi:hypothetical protein